MTTRYSYWNDDGIWIGYLEDFPDYWTQGESIDELRENLQELFSELSSGTIPHARRSAELKIG